MAYFKIAIIGRPNVGKSTLFNKLSHRKISIVDDTPGVTRDWKESLIDIGDVTCSLVDTAGYEYDKKNELAMLMMGQTNNAIKESDLILFMLDGRQGVTPIDCEYLKKIRKFGKQIIVIINKSENMKTVDDSEVFNLGVDNVIFISAEHSIGFYEMQKKILEFIPDKFKNPSLIEGENIQKNLHIAVVGRPNVGKSTLINGLLGYNRVITSAQAGTTRDAIFLKWQYNDQDITLIDTAGIRKRAKIIDHLEKLSIKDSKFAIDHCQIAIMVIDSTKPFEKQDLQILGQVVKEGRAVIIALNKWDLVTGNKEDLLIDIREYIEKTFTEIRGCNIIPICAEDKKNIFSLIDLCKDLFAIWDSRITTSQLNEFLDYIQCKNPPPLGKNKRRIKLKYITQIKSRPPTFKLHTNLPQSIPGNYYNYISNELRKNFNLNGVPIRIKLSKSDNPYKK